MTEPANAITKHRLSEETLRLIAERALSRSILSMSMKELAGGMCNAVYLIKADGQRLVLKIAPEPSVRIMSHERDILRTEAQALKLFGDKLDIPAPRLIRYDESLELCASPWLAMSYIEGRALNTLSPRPPEAQISEAKRRVGELCGAICSLPAPCFGIPAMPETHTQSNADFVIILFTLLLHDLKAAGGALPAASPSELLMRLEALRPILNEAIAPVYAHTDTWDGNLMITNGKLTGLVDFAAILYGDPLITHDFHDFEPTPKREFLEGFGKTAFTPNERIRLSIYALWQRLGMIVEREYRHYDDPGTYAWVLGEYEKELSKLDGMVRTIGL